MSGSRSLFYALQNERILKELKKFDTILENTMIFLMLCIDLFYLALIPQVSFMVSHLCTQRCGPQVLRVRVVEKEGRNGWKVS